MKKTTFIKFAVTAMLSLLSVQGFAQLPRNPRSQLPQSFMVDKQIEYNKMEIQEVTFPDYYDVEVTKWYHEDAIRLDPGLAVPINPMPRPSMCGNGDFETGLDTNEWKGAYGFIGGTLANGVVGGLITDGNAHQTLVSAGADPNVPINMVAPTGSTRAVRIGNAVNGAGTEMLTKTFTVPAGGTILNFWYALVLQDPGHSPADQPYFQVRVIDVATNTPILGTVNLGNGSDIAVSDAANPFFKSINNPTYGLIAYRDWSCASVNLSNLGGKKVTVQFITRDCTLGGHFGYAYLDDFCGSCAKNPYNISFASADCDNGKICFDYVLPQQGSLVGTVQIALNIYQNGVLLTTINSPVLSSGTNYCFGVTPGSIPGMNLSLSGYDYTAIGNFTIGSTSLSPFYLFSPPDGRIPGQNNDCAFVTPKQCCPGTNVIVNGGFESGNTGFTSAYTYQSAVAAGSVITGQYGILTDAQALTVSPTWITNCGAYNKHMVVNGGTCAGINKLVWSQTVAVKPGTTYKFCGEFKNLPQCGFDVKPRVTVNITQAAGQTVPLSASVGGTINVPNAPCNWVTLDQTVVIPAGLTSVTITIYLSEPTVNDGNDLAIDNLAFIALNPVGSSQTMFSFNPYNITGSTYNVSAAASVALPAGCKHWWEVAELNATTYAVIPSTEVINPPAWQPLATNTFIGYVGTSTLSGAAPGLFQMNKVYRFVYGRYCTCEGLTKRFLIYGPLGPKGTPGSGPRVLGSGFIEEQSTPGIGSTIRNTFSIFPNPTDNKVTIRKSATDADYEVKVYNAFGQLVKTVNMKAADTKTEIQLSEFAPGNYMLHVVSPKGTILHTEKVTKL